ncbi:uncharacterized protein BXIN_0097 [Babesia sp. Xinjiang]|uniref:uncharacterized protein n=1 Tax=Babesia sp. Xinjiang TaxID=462227 RepID=UPI000A230CED|nr:uncharacterized protein BXIN_0097 [Babesia sp. Xinjiang]ORM39647.1 hypothetical protein BXIN_0097 [Babesia sp. Xinjiang]
MESIAPTRYNYKGPENDSYRSAPKKKDYFFDDLAEYIIVDKDENDHVPSNKFQTGHTWTKDHTPVQSERTACIVNNDKRVEASTIKKLGTNETGEDEIKYEWKPGFCLQLGSQGRKAMLQLLRNVYKENKKFKHIFEKMNPPTTISNLPFFKISMLWELAYQLEVFDEAIKIHKTYGKVRSKAHDANGTNTGVHKSPKGRQIRSVDYMNELYHGKIEGDGRYCRSRSDGLQHLKRKMERLLASNKVTPEQFAKFMGSYKQKMTFVDVLKERMDENKRGSQRQQNNVYDYLNTYQCNTLDCAIMPH